MAVVVVRVDELPDGAGLVQVDVDDQGNKVIWLLATEITARSVETLILAVEAAFGIRIGRSRSQLRHS